MTSVPVLLYFYYLCFYVLCGGAGQAEVGAGPPEVRPSLGPWSAQEVPGRHRKSDPAIFGGKIMYIRLAYCAGQSVSF